jgi:hypothetical protein
MEAADTLYSGKLFLADEDGNYLGLSRKYDVRITNDALFLSEQRIPLLKIQRVVPVGSGLSVLYVDPEGLPSRIYLTTSDLFGIGRKKKITTFLEAIHSSVALARKLAPPEEVREAQKVVPSDTCHECKARGGAPVAFGTIYSVLVYSQWSTKEGVFCKKHATGHGLTALLTTGSLGWWSLRGIVIAPIYTFMNVRSLWQYSNLSKPVILLLAACALAPGFFIVAFVIHAGRSA